MGRQRVILLAANLSSVLARVTGSPLPETDDIFAPGYRTIARREDAKQSPSFAALSADPNITTVQFVADDTLTFYGAFYENTPDDLVIPDYTFGNSTVANATLKEVRLDSANNDVKPLADNLNVALHALQKDILSHIRSPFLQGPTHALHKRALPDWGDIVMIVTGVSAAFGFHALMKYAFAPVFDTPKISPFRVTSGIGPSRSAPGGDLAFANALSALSIFVGIAVSAMIQWVQTNPRIRVKAQLIAAWATLTALKSMGYAILSLVSIEPPFGEVITAYPSQEDVDRAVAGLLGGQVDVRDRALESLEEARQQIRDIRQELRDRLSQAGGTALPGVPPA